ncbi:hypothetical protein N0V83_003586 [Neocucurbitaria cava]|uniref:Uncharacterized protein n=1 Tax=Neocucurbitaria cava TaxID=798079 RepID=A0A9W9CPK1_9PLEO|nr:hypothetical protein N0V83_003586 [Neocucurbitaria cava]
MVMTFPKLATALRKLFTSKTASADTVPQKQFERVLPQPAARPPNMQIGQSRFQEHFDTSLTEIPTSWLEGHNPKLSKINKWKHRLCVNQKVLSFFEDFLTQKVLEPARQSKVQTNVKPLLPLTSDHVERDIHVLTTPKQSYKGRFRDSRLIYPGSSLRHQDNFVDIEKRAGHVDLAHVLSGLVDDYFASNNGPQLPKLPSPALLRCDSFVECDATVHCKGKISSRVHHPEQDRSVDGLYRADSPDVQPDDVVAASYIDDERLHTEETFEYPCLEDAVERCQSSSLPMVGVQQQRVEVLFSNAVQAPAEPDMQVVPTTTVAGVCEWKTENVPQVARMFGWESFVLDEEPETEAEWVVDGSKEMPTVESLRDHFEEVNWKEMHLVSADAFLEWYQFRTGQSF